MYETHITAAPSSLRPFLRMREIFQFTPAFIENLNPDGSLVGVGLLTIRRMHFDLDEDLHSMKHDAHLVADQMIREGINVERVKIEIPFEYLYPNDDYECERSEYLETHFKVTEVDDPGFLLDQGLLEHLPVSREKRTYWLTLRRRGYTVGGFKALTRITERYLRRNSVRIASSASELAVYDTAPERDSTWMSAWDGRASS